MTLSARSRADVAAALHDIQAPVRDRLEAVSAEIWRIVAADLPLAWMSCSAVATSARERADSVMRSGRVVA